MWLSGTRWAAGGEGARRRRRRRRMNGGCYLPSSFLQAERVQSLQWCTHFVPPADCPSIAPLHQFPISLLQHHPTTVRILASLFFSTETERAQYHAIAIFHTRVAAPLVTCHLSSLSVQPQPQPTATVPRCVYCSLAVSLCQVSGKATLGAVA